MIDFNFVNYNFGIKQFNLVFTGKEASKTCNSLTQIPLKKT